MTERMSEAEISECVATMQDARKRRREKIEAILEAFST